MGMQTQSSQRGQNCCRPDVKRAIDLSSHHVSDIHDLPPVLLRPLLRHVVRVPMAMMLLLLPLPLMLQVSPDGFVDGG